jgi:hypothetical protein
MGRARGILIMDRDNLAKTQSTYNQKWGSFFNTNQLSRKLWDARSLNIPHETTNRNERI